MLFAMWMVLSSFSPVYRQLCDMDTNPNNVFTGMGGMGASSGANSNVKPFQVDSSFPAFLASLPPISSCLPGFFCISPSDSHMSPSYPSGSPSKMTMPPCYAYALHCCHVPQPYVTCWGRRPTSQESQHRKLKLPGNGSQLPGHDMQNYPQMVFRATRK